MADIVLGTIDDGNGFAAGGSHAGIVWISATVGYHFFQTECSLDLVYVKTTDGGATWGCEVTISTDNFSHFDVWFDRWTNGDSNNIIHIAALANQNASLDYFQLDTSDDSVSCAVSIVSTTNLNIGTDYRTGNISITKSVGGTIYIAETARNDAANLYREGFWASTDGTCWSSLTVPFENTGDTARCDRIILAPMNECDTDDILGVYYDDSATALSRKVYDATCDSWSETSIDSAVNVSVAGDVGLGYSVVPDHSDDAIICIYSNTQNSASHDVRAVHIDGSGCMTQLTDVFTNEAGHHLDCSLFIDQTSGDWYAVFIGDPCETPFTAVSIYYKKSTDGGSTWGSAVQLDADCSAIHRWVRSGTMVISLGGRFQPVWSEDSGSASPDEHKTNADNGIDIGGAAVVFTAGSIVSKVLEVTRLY